MDLVSQCALRVANVVWRPGHGGFAFTVVCKATFELRPDVSPLAAEQEAVALVDVYAGEGGGITVASDLVPFKKRPEVLLTGHAYAPEGQPVSSVMARLVVGEIDKTVQVVGDRHFDLDGWLGDPASFKRMPLGWERAAGGLDTFNPAGRPLGGAARIDGTGKVAAPNLLPAGQRLRSRSDVVSPVGFGPIAPQWPSRAACLHQYAAGWDPRRWSEQPLPVDIDLGYFNAAPADQQRALPFGEEVICLEHLHPRFARLSTRLAPVAPVAMVDHGAGPQGLQLRCDTLIIDTDRGLAMLVWRGHVVLDRLDRPGRVVVAGPAAPQGVIPAWAVKMAINESDLDVTAVPSAFARPEAVLPFSQAAVAAPEPTAPGHVEVLPPSLNSEDSGTMTVVAGFGPPSVALPFVFPKSESLSRRAMPPGTSASALPFVSAPANEEGEGDGPVTPRRPDLREVTLPQAASAPLAASWAASSWDMPAIEVDRWRAPEFVAAPLAESETPAPPPMIGPIAVVAAEVARAEVAPEPDSEVEAGVEAAEPEVAIDVEVYPPVRCGGIAARLACAAGDGDKGDEILRGEDLDAERWERVHAHWLERIREEAARSRKTLLSEYDGGYVGALEGERGAIGLEEYARLAEAAERGEVLGALAEAGLPAGGWAHIHRVWIGRMVGDVRVGKEVRGAIEARRAAG